jgi:hypothetical protein
MKFNEWLTGSVNGISVKYRLKLKSESKFMKFLSYCLFWQRKTFMENYYSTIGRVMYVPTLNPNDVTLEHELIHVHDYQKNKVWFTLSYLLALPAVWTMRAHWERRAYAWYMQRLSWYDVERIKSHFCTSTYFWMNPFKKSVEKWVEQVRSGEYAPIKSVELGQ